MKRFLLGLLIVLSAITSLDARHSHAWWKRGNPGGGGGSAPVITSSTTLTGTAGQAISTYTITANNSPTSFGATSLPSGLSVNTSTGAITGTVAAAGTYTPNISATNASGTGNATLTITIGNKPAITSGLTASGPVNTAFSYTITASNSPTSFSATGLPAGLSVNSATGSIFGTPTGTGTSNITIGATNAYGTGTATLVLTIGAPPSINSALTASGTQNSAFTYSITGTNSPTSYGATPLPAGLSVNTSTGAITGTPPNSGLTNVTISATNAYGTGSATLALTINAAGTSYNILGVTTPATTTTNATAVALGVKFIPSSDGAITGLRFYKGAANTGTHVGHLWSTAGNQLGTLTFAGETASGWQTTSFASPISVTAGTTYIASYHTAAGNWSYTSFGLTSAIVNGPLTAPASAASGGNGVFTFSATPVFPTSTYQDTNYFVDVVFVPVATPPVINSSLTSSGTAGDAFTYTITATNTPTSFSASGLPSGLSVNTTTGVISGTPAAAGTSNITIGAANAFGSDSKTLVLTVGSKPSITSALTATATQGSAFTYTITGSSSPTSFSATSLPPGLSVNSSTGVISGTPTGSGVSNVTIGATNAYGTGTATLVLTVNASVTAYNVFGTTTPGTIDQADTQAVTLGMQFTSSTSGNVTGVRFYKSTANTGTHVGALWNSSGTQLATVTFTGETASGWQQQSFSSPVGITAGQTYTISYHAPNGHYSADTGGFNSAVTNGPLTAPISAGRYVYGPSSAWPCNSASCLYQNENYYVDLVFQPVAAPPVITSSLTGSVAAGNAYSYQIVATNVPTSYNATGLPSGLSVNTTTGLISGTPTVAGSSSVTLTATNAYGSDTKTLALTVTAGSPPVITSALTASGINGSSFGYTITASGSPTSFGATSLPAGLSINTSTGAISGTITAAVGSYSPTISATNTYGTDTETLVITVNAPGSTTDPIPADRKYTSSISGDGSLPSAWAKYSGVPGGIPTNRTQCAGGTVAAGASAATIQSRLNGCAANTYLLLAAGTWSNTGRINVPSNVTLRGAGADQTRFLGNSQLRLGSNPSVASLNTNITSGGTKGTNTIVVASTANLAVGTYIEVDKNTDANISNPVNNGRDVMQMNRITAISGTTVTVRNPWVSDFTSASSARIHYYYASNPNYANAIEDIGVNCQLSCTTAIMVDGCDSCWVKGVETSNFHGYHILVYNVMNASIVDSYLHDTTDGPNNSGVNCVGSGQYGISSNNRVENTIFNKDFPAIEFGNGVSACNGWYIGYNYVHGSVSQYGTNLVTWTMDMDHGGMSMMDLWEGNIGEMFGVDNYFGGSALGTSFRNYWTGWNRNYNVYGSPIRLLTWAYRFNVVGNVLGSSQENPNTYQTGCGVTGIYELGYPDIGNCGLTRHDGVAGTYPDPQVAASLMRWGNYDYFNDAVRWNTGELGGVATPPDQSLPISYVYTSTPSWWTAGIPFPPIGPDISGGNGDTAGKVNKIPAQVCWERNSNALLAAGAAGGAFNRAACYP